MKSFLTSLNSPPKVAIYLRISCVFWYLMHVLLWAQWPVSLQFAHHFTVSYGQGSMIFSVVVSVEPGLGPTVLSVMWALSPQVSHL